MTAEDIANDLRTVQTWAAASSHLRGAFGYQMRGCNYGRDALVQAWAWFHFGWEARAELE